MKSIDLLLIYSLIALFDIVLKENIFSLYLLIHVYRISERSTRVRLGELNGFEDHQLLTKFYKSQ